MYDYSAVMACPNAESHAPSQELVTRSKLSCLSWNKYLRTYLASSDYEGVVHVWDIATGQNVVEYEAHEKRIWSVDFCQTDPTLLMSGSDDGMVKVFCCHIAVQPSVCNCCVMHRSTRDCFLKSLVAHLQALVTQVCCNTRHFAAWLYCLDTALNGAMCHDCLSCTGSQHSHTFKLNCTANHPHCLPSRTVLPTTLTVFKLDCTANHPHCLS